MPKRRVSADAPLAPEDAAGGSFGAPRPARRSSPCPIDATTAVDLRSDTVTRPTPEMRRAIAEAAVGDAVLGDDPTAAELERYAAEVLGKGAALFFPSGIMANTTALLLHGRPGRKR